MLNLIRNFFRHMSGKPTDQSRPINYPVVKSAFPNQAWANHCINHIRQTRLPAIAVEDSLNSEHKVMQAEHWLHLMAAMCKFESNFRPTHTYQENFKNSRGEFVVSTGLFQLSYESVGGYGYRGLTTNDLKDPFLNIEIAVKIIEKLVVEDRRIFSITKENHRGASRYFSVLRYSRGKAGSVKAMALKWMYPDKVWGDA